MEMINIDINLALAVACGVFVGLVARDAMHWVLGFLGFGAKVSCSRTSEWQYKEGIRDASSAKQA